MVVTLGQQYNVGESCIILAIIRTNISIFLSFYSFSYREESRRTNDEGSQGLCARFANFSITKPWIRRPILLYYCLRHAVELSSDAVLDAVWNKYIGSSKLQCPSLLLNLRGAVQG